MRREFPVGRLIRQQLETAKARSGKQRFLRHAGAITGGPSDISSHKGFSIVTFARQNNQHSEIHKAHAKRRR